MPLSMPRHAPHPHLLALGILAALAPSFAMAQSAGSAEAADLDTVTVTGIRGSLQSSMNLKRDTVGVLDGIIAEDIGKFPDTNLAESMQRISGVSIDRTNSGEGQRVTVRGIGADFNLVLLNGRQMPTANLGEGYENLAGTRAFDFSNLASEAVSALEVYKSTRADIPTGGIGATINIKTSRPLESPGFHAGIGVKGVMDTSLDNTPRSYPGKSVTPEVSGIYSQTFADDRFGVAVSASYQERDSAYSQARINRGWRAFRGDDDRSLGRLPTRDEPDFNNYDITNRPEPNDIYARPQNFQYLVSSNQRTRRNAQATLQFAPTDAITATLDYTYADNRLHQYRSELQTTFTYIPGASTWTDGPVSAPTIYSEYGPNNNLALTMPGARTAVRSELESLGFNLDWKVNDALDLALDYHNSTAELRPDHYLGAFSFFVFEARVRGDTTLDLSGDFPILNMKLAPGVDKIGPEHLRATAAQFANNVSHSEIEQFQASGSFRFADYQALDFGLALTDVDNRMSRGANSTFTLNVPLPEGGAGIYPADLWQADNIGRYFNQFNGHNDPNLSDQILLFDMEAVRDFMAQATGRDDVYRAPSEFNINRHVMEKTRSFYLQWRNSFDLVVPISVAAGVRHEKTEVTSPATIVPPEGNLVWVGTNNYPFALATQAVTSNYTGEYSYWLPNIDLRAELRDNLVLRSSYGKSLGRPGWLDIQGGLALNTGYSLFGGTGSQGNPGLLPLESKNFDLSLEWYYGEGSYASVGYFRKKINNFIGNAIQTQSPYQIYSPIRGRYWNNAVAAGCTDGDEICIRNWIFANHANDPGVDVAAQTITGQPGDPLAEFAIEVPLNQRSDKLDGIEINVQHMLGDSGFGISANYTKVDSGLTFDNAAIGEQYPMVGLSDSANLVLFYDKHGWQVRAAYNWRDEFLLGIGGVAGTPPDPSYVEKYGQLDMNVTWEMNSQLAFFVEGINLTNETQRIHSRHQNMLMSVSQTGPRYMFGLRYKF